MEQLIYDLMTTIGTEMADTVRTIDEDCGQLEAVQTDEDQYPVAFPCVLIGTPDVQWESLKGGAQRGRASLTVRMAFDCYDDTHLYSGTEQAAAERLHTASRLNRLLHGRVPDGCCSPLLRRRSRQYSLPHGIKVYEAEYSVGVVDGADAEGGGGEGTG